LTPPASIGELDLPPMPPGGASLPHIEPLESAREQDPFGEAELPPPRSLKDTETKLLSQPPAAAGTGLIRQEGGGTSYGEVNLGGDSAELALEGPSRPLSGPGHEGTEFDAVPQEKGQPKLISDAKPLAEAPARTSLREPARPRGRMGMRLFIVVCVALASGGSLALLPDIGPFGAHWIVDRARSSQYEQLLRETTQNARKRFGLDTAPEATRSWNDADQARGRAKRMKPLSAHAAFVGYLRELRFGSASEIHARASVLLDELNQVNDIEYLDLARATRAATEGQLARARQSVQSILARDRGNIDALVVSGEVELRAHNNKAALEAWRAVEKLEPSARASFGLARAEFWSGETAAAETHAKQTLAKNPAHVGARILLARIASGRPGQEAAAVSALEAVTTQPALASSEELVNANTLLGDVHLSRSRISRAEAAYTAALALDPKAPGALRGLGEALFRAGRYSEAQARFEAGAQANPDDLEAKVGVAKSKFMLERLEDAKESLTKLREAHPTSVLSAYWHGRVLEALGERERAEKAYRTAIEQKNDTEPMLVESYIALALLYNQLGQADAARETLKSARERFPKTPAVHGALGDVALTQGRYVEAKSEFEQALALDADDLSMRFRLGVALRRDSKFEAAIKTFDAVAAVDPDFPGLALERGLLFEAAGKTEEALKQYEGARAKAPNDPDLMLRVGCGYASAGRTKEAEELLRKVLALRPTSAETQHCLGRALLAEGSRLADALRLLERATELDPHRAEYHLYVGWAANEAGTVIKAQHALDEAIKLDQGLADAYWQRGVLRSRQGAVRDAIADLTRALALRPTRYEAHAALADAYYDLGQEPLALREWAKAVESQPDQATWHFRYGKLLAANHKNELARTELARALELANKNPRGERWLWEANHLLARVIGPRPESIPYWEAFLKLGPLDSPYRAEGKAILERLGRPWTGN
jgi:tetratricopeptide (TPR) repeat protein